MKKISILVPCYNEEENIKPFYHALMEMIDKSFSKYLYEIVFVDNKSTDNSRNVIRSLCNQDKNVKAIFNIRNFGSLNSPFYGLCQVTGDAAVLISADFQDPVALIPQMVRKWEEGAKVVCAVKTSSKENPIVYFLRGAYYKIIRKLSFVRTTDHFFGFGLYDRSFLEILKSLNDPMPYLRGIVAEYAPDRVEISYKQEKRRAGKSSNNWYSLYDSAMLSFTSYTKAGLRVFTFLGFACAVGGFIVALIYFTLKLVYMEQFVAGIAPALIGLFILGGVQLIFIGMVGEYIIAMNSRLINRPLVIEEERLNFDNKDGEFLERKEDV